MNRIEVVRVGERGQIVIPKTIREALGINSKSKLIIFAMDDIIVIKKLSPPAIMKELREIFKRVDKNIEKFGELSEEEIISQIEEERSKSG